MSPILQGKSTDPLLQIHDPRLPRPLSRPHLPNLTRILLHAPRMHQTPTRGFIIIFIKRDVMVSRNYNLQLGVGLAEHFEHGFVFFDQTVVCDVAGVEKDVGGGEGVTVGVPAVIGGEGDGGVGVGDDAEAGLDGLGMRSRCHLSSME